MRAEHGSFARETRALVRLGAPMMATQFCVMGMGFLDTAMAGHYSSVDLAGVTLAGNLLWPVFMLMTGLTMSVTPIVAQLTGAARVGDAGAVVGQGLWIALFSSLVTIAILRNADLFFATLSAEPAVVEVAVNYLNAVSWGMPPGMIYILLRYTSEGLGYTRPPMSIALSALVLNGPLNYLLIYGAYGFPELGGEGCGWATAAVMWFEFVLMIFVSRRPFFRATRYLEHLRRPQGATIARILKIGVPIGTALFMEMAVYSVIGFLITAFGTSPQAANGIAGNINWMTYVLPMSLGSAAGIRVGFHVGAGDSDGARRVATTALKLSFAYAVLVSVILVGLRESLVGIYTTDPAVIAIAANLMIFIALYQIVDDTMATMEGILRGYKDTRVPMLFSLLGYWIVALPLGHALAAGWFGLPAIGVYGYWTGMTIGMLLVAVCLGIRLRRTSTDSVLIRRLALS